MSSPPPKRASSKKRGTTPQPNGTSSDDVRVAGKSQSGEWDHKLAFAIITILAFVTRFWGITHPDQVVFDEVHFGKFASHYLQRTYFFDVHPPFGKLLFAFAGWLVGYDGSFLFENIGDSYITNKVPYVAYRAMPATQGALTVATVYGIMWESGYSLPACILSAGLVLFDNAHIGQTRLILLDATLVFFMALSVWSYVRFYKLRDAPFSRKWWKWLLLTGINLSCVISTKYVGAFTFFSVGVPVAIDLWDLMDVNRKKGALTLVEFGKHLAARVIGLIVVPFLFYLFWFQVHFAVLNRSGPGDDFMSPQFQETLSENVMSAQSVVINYFDTISIRHKETKVYLHSHAEVYPLRYEDGRVSSNGQQVTGYPHNDTNNLWRLYSMASMPEQTGNVVVNGDIVRLKHVVTNTWLLTHDVASPYYPTNQEFTTVSEELAMGERWNDTLFEVKIEGAKAQAPFSTMSGQFKLVSHPYKVAMWTHTKPLPDWAFKQAEINGNKNLLQTSNIWYVDDIAGLPADSPRRVKEEKKVKTMPFLSKYLELQRAMFFHNNALTSSHPYSSFPIQWPFLLRGVSFWTENDTRQQIYFLGNPIGWWLTSSLLAVFAGIILADQATLRRGVDAMDKRTRSHLYNSTGFFFLTWAAHYVPFYIMGRQLFLHHYLPAHLASALVTGGLVEFIFNIDPNTVEDNIVATSKGKATPAPVTGKVRGKLATQSLIATWAATGAILSVVIWCYIFFAPLTYGKPGLDVAQVQSRKWLNYDLHFAK
ncbi:hypothetical protein KVT40_005744 [Elsinoe batatas]|uniref:Dolichyl-phosphate-mannose--protein mannosyltransferase n=1 Tax=Elsinoe batatas TaxID=2601811 RepID=A0A8K0L1P6_9PEZI|nr:hypothetical protein KVT40_005744 [Elsinoe batatas]